MDKIVENEISLNEVDVQKLDMKPGQILVVTIKHDDVSYESLSQLQGQFAQLIPNNKVLVFCVGTDGDLKLAVIDQPEKPVAKKAPISYCTDCSCGKKEQAESQNE
jgi:hypothetical protein